MKNKMVLAAVLLATILQMAAKTERLDDFLKKENFKGISRLDYNTLNQDEKNKIYTMAFSALLNARDAARGVLNKHFGKLDWKSLEDKKINQGLDAVKAHFAGLSGGAVVTSAPTKAVAVVQEQGQQGGQANIYQSEQGEGQQGVVAKLPQNIESLIDRIVTLDRTIYGPDSLKDEDINNLKSIILKDINQKTIQQVKQEIEAEIQKLQDSIKGYQQLAETQKKELASVAQHAGEAGYSLEEINQLFDETLQKYGYKVAIEELSNNLGRMRRE